MTYAIAIDETFSALADPTRRALIEQLRAGPLPVGTLARGLPISRPAVSQHLRVLSDAGLLSVTPQGAKRLYSLAPDGIAALRAYLDLVWDDALASFAAAAQAEAEASKE